MAEFITSSPNVMVEGKPVVRKGDQMVSNMRNTEPAPLNQPGAGLPRGFQPEEPEAADPAEVPDASGWDSNVKSPLNSFMAGLTTEGGE